MVFISRCIVKAIILCLLSARWRASSTYTKKAGSVGEQSIIDTGQSAVYD